MLISFFGSIFMGGIIGYASEKMGITRNGYLPSIIICIGGVVLFYMIRIMFGVSFGSHGVNALVSSAGALLIVPTAGRKR